MRQLNYNRLHYFWTVARGGSVTRASQELGVAQPTVTGQIRSLEAELGDRLFTRAGRGLVLTETGNTVFGYAEQIFSVGRELEDALQGRDANRLVRFSIGVSDAMPKLVSFQLLAPALALAPRLHVVCRQDKPDRLLAELALHRLDLVLSDAPVAPTSAVRGFSHLLGECGVTFFGTSELAAKHRRGFPRSLDGAPVLLPPSGGALRRSLDEWFAAQGVRPRIVGECDDSALMKIFAQSGAGFVPTPSVAEGEIKRQYRLVPVGKAPEVRERFYAISLERRLRHPAVAAISRAARTGLFEDPSARARPRRPAR